MTPQEEARLDILRRGGCVPVGYLGDYYGLAWPLQGECLDDFNVWHQRYPRRTTCPNGDVSRVALEAFMQAKEVVPFKWMAARLGMEEASLRDLIARLPELGIRPQQFVVYSGMVAESLPEFLVTHLPGLRFRTFSDHNSFCERLHAELKDTIGLEVESLFCATADMMGDNRQYASYFDCLTLKPLSGRHQLWLDFRKPLNLAPDRCSKLFYCENREVLREFCAGSREPEDLSEFERYVAEAEHGARL